MPTRPVPIPMRHSKVMSTIDFVQLKDEGTILDQVPDLLRGQHEVRRWEYAMALRAIQALHDRQPGTSLDPWTLLDVGGAGSQFWQVLQCLTPEPVVVVDPNAVDGPPTTARQSIESFADQGPSAWVDVITAISVIEHVPLVRPFLQACATLLRPGGLLFLTTDFWDCEGPDVAHFHWMRERIYNKEGIQRLLGYARDQRFRPFGLCDWAYHGPQVYDYSVASLGMIRR